MPFDPKNKLHVCCVVGIIVATMLIAVTVLVVVVLYTTDSGSSGSGGKAAASKNDTGSKGDASNEYQNRSRELHNEYRKKHQVDPLKLNKELNELAVKCANHYLKLGMIDHSCPTKIREDGSKAGENLYQRGAADLSDVKAVEDATNAWYNEVKDYKDYSKGMAGATGVVGHFTQLVWKASMELGVGVAKGKITIVVALYSPHGNFNNMYKENVFPPITIV